MSDKKEMIVKVDDTVRSKKPLKKEIRNLLDEIREQVVKEVAKKWKQR